MSRFIVALTAALVALGLVATPAAAVPPVHDTLVIHNVVEDSGEACGFPVRWEINIDARRTQFFDADGALERVHLMIKEDNTVTNLDTGLELVEGPDAFMQRTIFEEGGTVRVETAGLSLIIHAGADSVLDAGRFVIREGPEGSVLLHAAGHNEPRLLLLEGGFPAVLAVFCDVLA